VPGKFDHRWQSLSEHLDQVLELEEADRPQWLEALKQSDPEMAAMLSEAPWIGRTGEQRFTLEGNLLARLDHANIARLINAGVLAGTQPYLILEYIEGEPIDVYCDRQNLGLEARIGLFLDVLAAVAHAHSHLIVHRDIKPGNVFVTQSGVVKLLDFGIAKLLQNDTGAAALTQSNATPLTPQFAAPEQLLGKRVPTVTDVYSLGLLLYVLLTGSTRWQRMVIRASS
jgi:eukaryotic-like serine/threonine-protein kinase